MEPVGLTDPLAAERTRFAARRRLFGGHEGPLRVGRFEVGERIGAGGMGAVYAAHDPELARDVALKVLHGGGAGAALVAEAKALARLRHPNVVSVYEVGAFREHTFVAMERVAGPSLRAWLRERERSWREVTDVFAGAARGLQAAHAAGLVHRDFKPDNVVVDEAGQARVVDFGLARATEHDDAEEDSHAPPSGSAPPASAPGSSRTRTRLAGTPAYMAPELFEGRPASAASDQFAFCVSLFESLAGKLPFAADNVADMATLLTKGHPPPELPPSDVPRHVRAALRRGLARRPEDRHPNMEALLAALMRDPAKQRARRIAGALAVVAILSAGLLAARGASRPPLCEGAEARVSTAYGPAAKEKLRAAFEATRAPDAASAFETVTRSLDAYASAWTAMYRDSCEATNVRGDQSRDLLDLRTRCLDRRHEALRATVAALSSADARLVARSVALVERLPPIATCADVEALRAVVPPPEDPVKRARLAELEKALEGARVAFAAGRLTEAVEKASRLADDAKALDYRPFIAEALFLQGDVTLQRGDHPGAEAALSEAVKAAQATGYTEIVAQAAVRLVGVTGLKRRQFDKAKVWIDVAEASVERVNNPALRALLDDRAGAVLSEQGNIDEALRRLERAVRATEARGATDTMNFAGYLNDWAAVLDRAGRHDAALAAYKRAIAIEERLRGAHHPELAHALNNLAIVLERKRRYEEARAAYQRALDIAEELGGIDGMADFLDNLAGVLGRMGRLDEAMDKRRRALAMRESASPPDLPGLASSWNNIGVAHQKAKQYDEALAAYEKSLALRRSVYGEDHPEVASALGNVGEIHEARKDLKKALSFFTQAAAMKEKAVGPAHDEVGYWLAAQGRVEVALKRIPEGTRHLERATAILEAADADVEDLARARFELGRALWDGGGGDRKRAWDLAERAREALSEAGVPGRTVEIEAWQKGKVGPPR